MENYSWVFYALIWEVLGLLSWCWANYLAYQDNPSSNNNPKKWVFFALAPTLGPILGLMVAIIALVERRGFGLRFK